MKPVAEYTDQEILEAAHKLRVGYGMKHVIRYHSTRDTAIHNESVAEHVFALIYLAQYFLRVEAKAAGLDHERVYSTLLFHDFGEIKYGDVSTYSKTQEHEDREKEAAVEIFASLPEPLNKVGWGLWQEYEEHITPEGKFCYALDKIEPLFELLDPVNEVSVKRLKVTYDMHVANKFKAGKDFPIIMRFIEVLSKDMKDRECFGKVKMR